MVIYRNAHHYNGHPTRQLPQRYSNAVVGLATLLGWRTCTAASLGAGHIIQARASRWQTAAGMADEEPKTWKAGRPSVVIRPAHDSKQVEVLIGWREDWLGSFVY